MKEKVTFSVMSVLIMYALLKEIFEFMCTLTGLQFDKLTFARSILSDQDYIFPFSASLLCSQLSQLIDADIFIAD